MTITACLIKNHFRNDLQNKVVKCLKIPLRNSCFMLASRLMAGDGSFVNLVDGSCSNFMEPIMRAAFPLVIGGCCIMLLVIYIVHYCLTLLHRGWLLSVTSPQRTNSAA